MMLLSHRHIKQNLALQSPRQLQAGGMPYITMMYLLRHRYIKHRALQYPRQQVPGVIKFTRMSLHRCIRLQLQLQPHMHLKLLHRGEMRSISNLYLKLQSQKLRQVGEIKYIIIRWRIGGYCINSNNVFFSFFQTPFLRHLFSLSDIRSRLSIRVGKFPVVIRVSAVVRMICSLSVV